MPEVVARFGVTPRRRDILDGLLTYRAALRSEGIAGFQWLDGSFLDFKPTEPNDVDVVSFIDNARAVDVQTRFDRGVVKSELFVDAYYVDLVLRDDDGALVHDPIGLVESTHYWFGLFSHSRLREWRGLIQVSLDDNGADDRAAREMLAIMSVVES